MADPTFIINDALIRYNLAPDKGSVAIEVVNDASTLFGIVTLKGWTKDSASITNCYFERDISLPPSTMIIEPKPKENA